MSDELQNIAERYARRDAISAWRYSRLNPAVNAMVQERQRSLLRLFKRLGLRDLSQIRFLEVGCGSGGNLLELIELGARPANLVANELLPQRVAVARQLLPPAVQLHAGDAAQLDFPDGAFDIVYQSTVFSSILDDALQERLATAMWRWARPGGGVLWYDFTFNNPRNPDVRGVPLRRLRSLFPEGRLLTQRVTLAPPIARAVARVHPALYDLCNLLPLARTHVLCFIQKS